MQELVMLARAHSNIALIVGDLGYSVIEPFADEFPDRFINAGVAEQNMAGLAAGMASEGYHVFIYSIANFPTFRCAETIRNDIAYHNLPVTIVAVGGGLAYGALGYSHHAVQDYALMRSFPNMMIAAPGDSMEIVACLRYLINNPQPSYFRLGKNEGAPIHFSVPTIEPGIWVPVKSRNDVSDSHVFLSTGATLSYAIDKYYLGEATSIYSLPLWAQSVKDRQLLQIEKKAKVTTIEDHLIDGGFGSWMLESVVNTSKSALQKISIRALDPIVCGTVGSQDVLNVFGGLR